MSYYYCIMCLVLIDSEIEFITKNVYFNEDNQNIILHIDATTATSYYKDAMVQNTSYY